MGHRGQNGGKRRKGHAFLPTLQMYFVFMRPSDPGSCMAEGGTSTTHSLQEEAQGRTVAHLAAAGSKGQNFKNGAEILGIASAFCLTEFSLGFPKGMVFETRVCHSPRLCSI